jgi:hypothetical protein
MCLVAIAALDATKAQVPSVEPKYMSSSSVLSHNSVIESLSRDIVGLEKSVNSWNNKYIIFLILSIIVASLTLFAQFKTIRDARTLSDKQAALDREKDRQLSSELSERDSRIAELKTASETARAELAASGVRIKEAEAEIARAHAESKDAVARVASADARSAEASEKAEAFRLDIAKANERAAEADNSTAHARLELAKLQALMADRVLTEAQGNSIRERLKPFSGQEFQMITYWEVREPKALTDRIFMILTTAGWKYVQTGGMQLMGGDTGIKVWRHPEADGKTQRATDELIAALNSGGLAATLHIEESRGSPKHNRIFINVGAKP